MVAYSANEANSARVTQLAQCYEGKKITNKVTKYPTNHKPNKRNIVIGKKRLKKNRSNIPNEQAYNNSYSEKRLLQEKTAFFRSIKKIVAENVTNKITNNTLKKSFVSKSKLFRTHVSKEKNNKFTHLVDKNTQFTKAGVEIQPLTIKSNGIQTKKYSPNQTKKGTLKIENMEKKSLEVKPKIFNKPHILHEKFQLLINEYIANQDNYKYLASEAIRKNEIFIIIGNSNTVRIALEKRGWIQKLTEAQDTYLKNSLISESTKNVESNLRTVIISHFLKKKIQPNLIWIVRNTEKSLKNLDTRLSPLINRLKSEDKYFTTKGGLCTALQNRYWFHIDNVSEVNAPRSYNIFLNEELNTFITDYRITACTSLLKWFVRGERDRKKKLISNEGKISLSTILFALKTCKTYIYDKRHRYLDKDILHKSPKTNEWEEFIANYSKLINNQEHFTSHDKPVFNYYMELSYTILHELYKYRPQLDCEGFYNIWIIKPAQCCRGRGILLDNRIKDIINTTKAGVNKYVVQKYIEMPLLIYETKFDIRQYFVITSTYPLVIWMYKNCYLRFCSQNYRLDDFHESIHLTNNAVQCKYKNCPDRHPNLPQSNMWPLAEFKKYLKEAGNPLVWDSIINPEMKKNIIGAMLSCQDGMNQYKNRFELYGCDFVLDNDYKPWLIEINSSPDMSPSTDVTAKICPETLEDLIKVILDHKRNSKTPTGHFECIFKQRMTNGKTDVDASTMVACGARLSKKYFCKLQNVHEPHYEKAGVMRDADIHVPLKHDTGILQSDSMMLKETPSIGETMVSHYKKVSSFCSIEDIEKSQSVNDEKINTNDDKLSNASFGDLL